MPNVRQIILRPKRVAAIASRHPWVMAPSIVEPVDQPEAGESVDLVLPDGKWLARGIYNPNSHIRIRLYSWDQSIDVSDDLFRKRIDQAIDLRRQLSDCHPQSAQRMIFSEADQLSGLIVDRYAQYLVVHATARAIVDRLTTVIDQLKERLQPTAIFVQVDEKTAAMEGVSPRQEFVFGSAPTAPVEIEEHGIRLLIDLDGGQKTGYYLDQRDNRRAAADWVRPGAKVLDICCYLGGFSLAIARWSQASHILGIDSSQRALDQARRHAQLNGLTNIDFESGDFFDTLGAFVNQKREFDVVVLDPPRMAGSRDQMAQALRAYHRLNLLATRLLPPGGILITCSCSGRVSRSDFRDVLLGVSKQAGREIQILEQRGAASDHPSIVTVPETDYLKCLICRVL
jgi:23S rRNA (cytosine1962-C5)-methyltransferase